VGRWSQLTKKRNHGMAMAVRSLVNKVAIAGFAPEGGKPGENKVKLIVLAGEGGYGAENGGDHLVVRMQDRGDEGHAREVVRGR